jgi:hypothetical protein
MRPWLELTAFGHIPALPSGGKAHFRGIRAGWAVFSGLAKCEPNITAAIATQAIWHRMSCPLVNCRFATAQAPQPLLGKKKSPEKIPAWRL